MEAVQKITPKKFIAGVSVGIIVLIFGVIGYFLKFDFNLVLLLLIFGGGLLTMMIVTRKGVTYTEREQKFTEVGQEAFLISTGAGSKYFLSWVSILLFTTLIFIAFSANKIYGISGFNLILPALPISVISIVVGFFGIRDIKRKPVGKYDKYFGYTSIILGILIVINFFNSMFDNIFSGIFLLTMAAINLIFGIYLILKTREIK